MTGNRLLHQVLLYERRSHMSGGIYDRIQTDFAYTSNRIEGSTLTRDQTRYIYETHTVEGIARVNDVIELVNHFRCFDYILDTITVPLTGEYIKHLHCMLKSGIITERPMAEIIGDYKRYPNEVGDIRTALPEDVPERIDGLFERFNNTSPHTLEDIAEFHADFEKIHPFSDGNGRVGRLLMMKQCLEGSVTPFFIGEEKKFAYYSGLTEWQRGGNREPLLREFRTAQDEMKSVLDYFRISYNH